MSSEVVSKNDVNCKINKPNGSNQQQQLSLSPKQQCQQQQSPPGSSYCPSPILQQESLSSCFLDDFVISFKKQTEGQLHCQDNSAERIIKQENYILEDDDDGCNNDINNNNNLIVIEDQSEIVKDKGKKKNKLRKTTKAVATTATTTTKRRQRQRRQLIESPKKTRKRQKKDSNNGGNQDIFNKKTGIIESPDQQNDMQILMENTGNVEEKREHEINSNSKNIQLDNPASYEDDDDADLIHLQQLIARPKKQNQEFPSKIKVEESISNKQSQSQNMYVQLGRQQLTQQSDSCVVQVLRSSQNSQCQYQGGNTKQLNSQLLQRQEFQGQQSENKILLLSQSDGKLQGEQNFKDLADYYEQKYSQQASLQGANQQLEVELISSQRSAGQQEVQKQSQQSTKSQSNTKSELSLSQQKQQQDQRIFQQDFQQQQLNQSEPIIAPNQINGQNSQRISNQQTQSSTNLQNSLPNQNAIVHPISASSFCTVENKFKEKIVDLLCYFTEIEQQKERSQEITPSDQLFGIAAKTFTEAIQREVAKQTQEILIKAGLKNIGNNEVDVKVNNVQITQPEVVVEKYIISPGMPLITGEVREQQQKQQQSENRQILENEKGKIAIGCRNEHKENYMNNQKQVIEEQLTFEKKHTLSHDVKGSELFQINHNNQGVKQGINLNSNTCIVNQPAQKKKLSDLRKKDKQITNQVAAVITQPQPLQAGQEVTAQVEQQQCKQSQLREGCVASNQVQNNVLRSLEIIAGNPNEKIAANQDKLVQLPGIHGEVVINDSQQSTISTEKRNTVFVATNAGQRNQNLIPIPAAVTTTTFVPTTISVTVSDNQRKVNDQLNEKQAVPKVDRSFAIISSKSSIRNVMKLQTNKDNESRLYGSFTRDIADIIVNHRFDPKQFTQEELVGNKGQEEGEITNEQQNNQQQSLKAQSPQLIDLANVQKFYYKVCWKRRSSGRIPLPTYFTFKQLSDSAPRLLFDYFTKIAKLRIIKNQ